MKLSTKGAAILMAVAGFGAPRPAAADETWHEVEPLDLKTVPVVEIAPAPKFERVSHGGYDHDWILSAAEHPKAKAFAPSNAEKVRLEEPKRGGNISVVINDNLEYPSRNGITRFFQKAPESEAMTVSCGRGPDVTQSVRSFALGHTDGGGYRVAYRHAWFAYIPCKGELLRSYETKVTPVAKGLAFVWRTSCPSCEDGKKERLNLLTPNALSFDTGQKGTGEFTFFTFMIEGGSFSIEPGKNASFEGKFENSAVLGWNRVLDKPLPTPPFTFLRIEMIRGAKDPLPIARVYTR